MRFGGGEIIVVVYLFFLVGGLSLAFMLVSAIVRISHAFVSISRSLEEIARAYTNRLP